jgi:hypothetical protein
VYRTNEKVSGLHGSVLCGGGDRLHVLPTLRLFR